MLQPVKIAGKWKKTPQNSNNLNVWEAWKPVPVLVNFINKN